MTVKLKEEDVVLCKVKKIEGTTVFLEIEDYEAEGSMVLSEVAAGRIRNLRQYVSPNRLVVCKVLKISEGHIELSLRRVTAKEREAVLEGYKKEKALNSVLKVVGEDSEKIIGEIKEENTIPDFLAEVEENPKVLEKFLSKEKAKKVFEIISEKEEKEKKVEKRINLRSFSEQGVKDIKEILDVEAEIHYLGSGKFSVSAKGRDFKEANAKLNYALEEMEKRAKEKKAVFEVLREK